MAKTVLYQVIFLVASFLSAQVLEMYLAGSEP